MAGLVGETLEDRVGSEERGMSGESELEGGDGRVALRAEDYDTYLCEFTRGEDCYERTYSATGSRHSFCLGT